MSNLVILPKIPELKPEYLRVSLKKSKRDYKVKKLLSPNNKGQLVVQLSISPTDSSGKARPNLSGLPDVAYHTHTFTEVELTREDFDPKLAILDLVESMVAKKEKELDSRKKLESLGESWEELENS